MPRAWQEGQPEESWRVVWRPCLAWSRNCRGPCLEALDSQIFCRSCLYFFWMICVKPLSVLPQFARTLLPLRSRRRPAQAAGLYTPRDWQNWEFAAEVFFGAWGLGRKLGPVVDLQTQDAFKKLVAEAQNHPALSSGRSSMTNVHAPSLMSPMHRASRLLKLNLKLAEPLFTSLVSRHTTGISLYKQL